MFFFSKGYYPVVISAKHVIFDKIFNTKYFYIQYVADRETSIIHCQNIWMQIL